MLERALTNRSWPMSAAILMCLAGFAPLAVMAAPDPACDPMFNAFTKLLQTPNHQYMSQSSATDALIHGGKLHTSESISVNDMSFVKNNDQWRKVPITSQDMLKRQNEARQTSKESCHLLENDASEDDAAVYNSHSETSKGRSDLKIWISKATGLPVREEIDLDLGGDTGKSHSSVRFDYDHIEPPKDAK